MSEALTEAAAEAVTETGTEAETAPTPRPYNVAPEVLVGTGAKRTDGETAEEESETEGPYRGYMYATEDCFVRSEPEYDETNENLVGVLDEGQQVFVIGLEENGWARIRFEGTRLGYMNSVYLTDQRPSWMGPDENAESMDAGETVLDPEYAGSQGAVQILQTHGTDGQQSAGGATAGDGSSTPETAPAQPETRQTEPPETEPPEPVFMTMTGTCYMRSYADYGDNIIGEYPAGTVVEFLEDAGGWYKVSVDGQVGYMGARFFY